ncbi:MAG TPA: hypothetical protein VME18_02155 [Acidobacteriaceae bacterium]|nr:hypothetical protein [Acidobacteriaceae bacterium]
MTHMRWRSPRSLALFAVLAASCALGWGQAIKVRSRELEPLAPIGGGALTVSASPATVDFTLVSKGTAQGSSGVTVTTTWDETGGGAEVSLYAWLGSSTAALSNEDSSTYVIPSSAVLGQMTTGSPTSYTAFTQTTPGGIAGAGLTLLNDVSVSESRYGSDSRSDVLNLEINLSGMPALPAGTYTGTLTLQASIN